MKVMVCVYIEFVYIFFVLLVPDIVWLNVYTLLQTSLIVWDDDDDGGCGGGEAKQLSLG